MVRNPLNFEVVQKNSYHYLSLKILKNEGKPMTAVQILEKIKKHKKITSKTPGDTLRSVLQRSSYLERVGHGYYKIKSGAKIPKI